MQKNRIGRFAGGVAVSLAAILLVTSIIDSQSNVAQAKEVFRDVEDIRKQMTEAGEPFTILEIVDELSVFPTADEIPDAAATVTLGEEEIGYLIGGSEAYAEYYQALVTKSREFIAALAPTDTQIPDITEIQENLEKVSANYLELRDALEHAGLLSPGAPLAEAETGETFAPSPEDFRQRIASVKIASVTDGFLVEHPDGLYAEVNGIYEYVGAADAVSFFLEAGNESVSGNTTVSENDTVSGNDALPEDDTVSGNDTDADTGIEVDGENTPETGTDTEAGTETDTGMDTEAGSEGGEEGSTEPGAEADTSQEAEEGADSPSEAATENLTDMASGLRHVFLRTAELEEPSEATEETIVPEEEAVTMAVGTRYHFYESEAEIPEELRDMAIPVSKDPQNGEGKIETIYEFSFRGLVNGEWFRTEVFGIEPDDKEGLAGMPIRVITCTPDDSELPEHIAAADLVYVNADEKRIAVDGTETIIGKDISAEAAIALLSRITATPDLPCIINDGMYTAFNQTSGAPDDSSLRENTNLNKLIQILYQKEVKRAFADGTENFGSADTWKLDIGSEPWSNLKIITSPDDAGAEAADANRTGKGHFVRNNIYVIGSPDGTQKPVYQGFSVKLADTDPADFAEVEFRIELENYDREQQGLSPVDTLWTPAVAVQTILVYTGEPVIIEKSSLRVLELEPCYSFTYAGSPEKNQRFRDKYLPENSKVEIEIVGMTTSEFCGKNEDINVEYDMIYIGSNTELMNAVELVDAGGTGTGEFAIGYNDPEMFGVVYAHTGDTLIMSPNPNNNYQGLVSGDNVNQRYRYSGNDILEEQKEKLLEFLESGMPVVVADDFFFPSSSRDIAKISAKGYGHIEADGGFAEDSSVRYVSRMNATGGFTERKRNGILDTSSYLYQFVKAAVGADGEGSVVWENRSYKNFLTEDEVKAESFARYINQPKLTLRMMSYPTEYRYTTKQSNGATVIEDATYLSPNAEGSYFLTYEFIVSNIASVSSAAASHTVTLYIDSNMDGKFAGTREKMDGLSVTDLNSGAGIDSTQLKTGVPYRVTRQLPDEFAGAIPWKLAIHDNGNESIRGAVTGITAVKAEKQKIRVLQLAQRDNLQAEVEKNPNGLWATLLGNVPDFEVELTSVDAAKYFANDGATMAQVGDLGTYDMLMLGFTDMYLTTLTGNTTNGERLQAILDFVKDGKCVLFSHDNTSWWNGPYQDNTLNMAIRDMTGLDRYGVSIGRGTIGSAAEGNNYIRGGQSIEKDSKEALEQYLFAGGIGEKYSRDVAYKVNSDQRVMVSETQAVTYCGNVNNILGEDKNEFMYLKPFNSGVRNNWNRWWGTEPCRVEKVNSGAITDYPYKLPDTIEVAATHGQYYQLDLESDTDGDGEGDIAVWYCLNSSNRGINRDDIYDFSPNDVRNNYYIYNRGNVTYTGMGHRTTGSEEEIKLFINTMIAAYRVGVKSPQIRIVENAQDLTEKSYDVIPYDEAVSEEQKESGRVPVYRIYFQAKDNNFISNSAKKISYRLLLEENTGTEEIFAGGEKIKVINKTQDWRVHHSVTGAEVPVGDDPGDNPDRGITGGSLENAAVYYVDVPVTLLDGKDSFRLYVEVQSTVTKNGKDNVSAKVYDTITVNKLQLFDLD